MGRSSERGCFGWSAHAAYRCRSQAGALGNCVSIEVGAFATLNVTGDVGATSIIKLGGGGDCESDYFCEPTSAPACTKAAQPGYQNCGASTPATTPIYALRL